MSYHKLKIHKHNINSIFKIQEEFYEYVDAVATKNPVMAVQELSDLYGCIENEVVKYGMSVDDLKVMSDLTKSVFNSGVRKPLGFIEYLKDNCDYIKSFGLGFVQVKCVDINYNFYSDKLEKFSDYEAPHNHQHDFVSEVIKGILHEKIYEVSKGEKIGYCGCGDTSKEIRFDSKFLTEINHKQGEYYLRLRDEYHSVSASHGTVTKLCKIGDKANAFVLGEKTNQQFESEYSVEELWDIVEDVWNV